MAKSKVSKEQKPIKRPLKRNGETGKSRSEGSALGFPLQAWTAGLRRAKGAEARSGRRGFVFVVADKDSKVLKKLLTGHLNKWQMTSALESDNDALFFQGANGPVWILVRSPKGAKTPTEFNLEKSGYARVRDLVGGVFAPMQPYKLEKLVFETVGLTAEEERAIVVGLELASYSYQENRPQAPKARKARPNLIIKSGGESLTPEAVRAASQLGLAVNLARHYTNLPGGDLNPRTYAESVVELFADSANVMVEVWEGDQLEAERMGLLVAVGKGALEGPRFVRLSYRPKSASAAGVRPLALVGKGVTFDSGGLDIKPSSGMRLMKKDMGGSAAVVALVKWAEMTGLALPLDAYISLAENAVSSRSFHPGDVFVARNGMTVEIGNTDAEGRLVMADALDVAVEAKPQAVIDLATLTGAIKVGLGADVAGLFANSDHLASLLTGAGLSRGDLMWRMPLFQGYRGQLKSSVADCSNCSDGGFGGAITAALFLESFVKDVPWAHLDIYAWKDSAGGAFAEGGASGQPVQALAEALTRLAEENAASEMA